MPRAYPRPWVARPGGSRRELRPGVWLVRWREGRRRPSRTLNLTPGEIDQWLREKAANRQRARMGLTVRTAWADAIAEARVRFEARGRSSQHVEELVRLVERCRAWADGLDLWELSCEHIAGFLDSQRVRERYGVRKAISGRTLNKKRALLSSFFKVLKRQPRLVTSNPAEGVDKEAEHAPLPRLVTPAEYAAVWQASEPPIRDLLDWCLLTGARFGEVKRMRRTDIREGVWEIPIRKHGIPHRLPIAPELAEIALRQPLARDGLVWHISVAPRGDGRGLNAGGPVTNHWALKVLRERCRRAGVRPFGWHALRHAAASWADAGGLALSAIKVYLGHSQASTTARYAHGTEQSGLQAVQTLLLARRADALQSVKEA